MEGEQVIYSTRRLNSYFCREFSLIKRRSEDLHIEMFLNKLEIIQGQE
jgi:hypothetical protein